MQELRRTCSLRKDPYPFMDRPNLTPLEMSGSQNLAKVVQDRSE